MITNALTTAAALSDDALLARVQVLAGRERQATVELVAHLAELDTRKILVAEGYSLFTYCTKRLGLSEDAACTRIEVARAARRFPVVLDRLAEGSVNLTGIRLLARHLTVDNHEEVLAAATGRSKREIEVLAARLAPRADVPSSVRKLPVPVPAGQPCLDTPATKAASEQAALVLTRPDAGEHGGPVSGSGVAVPPARRPVVAPLSSERYQVRLTVGKGTHDTLRRLQDLLRREIPSGDPALIVDRALTLLLKDVEKRKLAATTRPERGAVIRSRTDTSSRQPSSPSRHVPAAVRRAVWERDDAYESELVFGVSAVRERLEPWERPGPVTLRATP